MQINSGFKTKKFICLIILLFQSSKQAENIFVFLLLCSWYFGKIRSLLFPIFSQCSLFVVTDNRFIFEKYSLSFNLCYIFSGDWRSWLSSASFFCYSQQGCHFYILFLSAKLVIHCLPLFQMPFL